MIVAAFVFVRVERISVMFLKSDMEYPLFETLSKLSNEANGISSVVVNA
jgi:hypothetical protein